MNVISKLLLFFRNCTNTSVGKITVIDEDFPVYCVFLRLSAFGEGPAVLVHQDAGCYRDVEGVDVA